MTQHNKLRAYALELFERNIGNDPQGNLLYKWQDNCLHLLYGEDYEITYLELDEAKTHLDGYAENEDLPLINASHGILPENVMQYLATENVYVASDRRRPFPLYQFVHEFTHYWVISGLSLGIHPSLETVVTPLASHGPVFLRSLLMFLWIYYKPKHIFFEKELIGNARDYGLAVAEIEAADLKNLWNEGRMTRLKFESGDHPDLDSVREFLLRLADLDRMVVTGATHL